MRKTAFTTKRRAQAERKGPSNKGEICWRICRKRSINDICKCGLAIGNQSGTMMAVAMDERSVNEVIDWIEPPNLPAMIGPAVAAGISTQSITPCAKIASIGSKR